VLYHNSQQDISKLIRAINISEQWQVTFPKTPKLPPACIIINTTMLDKL